MQAEFSDGQLYQQLFELQTKKEEFQGLLELGKHDCDDFLALRVREFGGGRHFVYQCQECGRQRGNSKGREEALKLNGGIDPLPYDESIEIKNDRRQRHLSETISNIYAEEMQIRARIHGLSLENSHSRFEQQKKRRDDANNRLSELLVEFEADFGEEEVISCLVQQIVNRKKRRYVERQKDTQRFTNEKELKDWFFERFHSDFLIYEEVSGVHLAEKVNVRIDFILYPKPHLIENGFIDQPFGVEVKYFKQESGFTHKTSRGLWQAISYNDCLFSIKDHEFKTKFCLLFSNLSFSAETALIKNLGYEWENDQAEWSGMLHVANHARVGILSISGDKASMKGWKISFAGGTYFVLSSHNNEVSYRLSNPDIVNKIRIGNF